MPAVDTTQRLLSRLPRCRQAADLRVGARAFGLCRRLLRRSAELSGRVSGYALDGGKLVEVQGTAEHGSFDRAQLNAMLDAGLAATAKLVELQKKVLG